MATVRLTLHVPKQSKTKVNNFSDLLFQGYEDLNLTGFDRLNFPLKDSLIAYTLRKFFEKNR